MKRENSAIFYAFIYVIIVSVINAVMSKLLNVDIYLLFLVNILVILYQIWHFITSKEDDKK